MDTADEINAFLQGVKNGTIKPPSDAPDYPEDTFYGVDRNAGLIPLYLALKPLAQLAQVSKPSFETKTLQELTVASAALVCLTHGLEELRPLIGDLFVDTIMILLARDI
jgi:hypothetical protein